MDLHYSQTRLIYKKPIFWFHYLMDLHYSQTSTGLAAAQFSFHYLMDLHYSQTCGICGRRRYLFHNHTLFSNNKQETPLWLMVSLPYGFTLFSNGLAVNKNWNEFHYLMDLHYSQTLVKNPSVASLFHYLMDLHYSQTIVPKYGNLSRFHYLMDLHYSQTSNLK